jgi:hypothetical protein
MSTGDTGQIVPSLAKYVPESKSRQLCKDIEIYGSVQVLRQRPEAPETES